MINSRRETWMISKKCFFSCLQTVCWGFHETSNLFSKHFFYSFVSSLSHSPVILVHYTSWKFSQYFVFIFRTALNFLNKIDHSHQSSNKNILILLYVKPETTAHTQISISRYDILFTNFLPYFEIETSIANGFLVNEVS